LLTCNCFPSCFAALWSFHCPPCSNDFPCKSLQQRFSSLCPPSLPSLDALICGCCSVRSVRSRAQGSFLTLLLLPSPSLLTQAFFVLASLPPFP
jgi:hypothetical protein